MSAPPPRGRVLHVVQDTAIDPRHRHLGSTKAIRGRTDYFVTRGIPYTELVTDRTAAGILRAVRNSGLDECAAVVFEQTLSPQAMAWVRSAAPTIRVVVTSFNAELLHRLDILRADGFSFSTPSHLRQLVIKSLRDIRSGRVADRILTISSWEALHYWPRIVQPTKIRYIPWYLPDSYLHEVPRGAEKRRRCICLLSTIPNPLIADAARQFARAVRELGSSAPDWDFCMTGDRADYAIPAPARIQWTGLVPSPYPLLAESRALAILSDYGYGFKTKILEAVLARTYVLLTPRLLARVPDVLHPYCIPTNPRSATSFATALERALTPFPATDLNATLRAQAFAVLDEALWGSR